MGQPSRCIWEAESLASATREVRLARSKRSGRVGAAEIASGAALGALVGFLVRDLNLLTLLSYWGDLAPLLLATTAAGAILGRLGLGRLVGAAALALGLLWGLVAFTPVTAALTPGLVRRDPLRPADGVFVLASRLQSDGDPTTPALSRLVHGVELLGEGLAPRLIVSELPPPSRSYADRARQLLGHLDLPREVLSVGPVRRTRDEALAVRALAGRRALRRLIVVTSPLHSRRACAALEHEGIEVVCSPAVETEYDLETLDRADDRLAAFGGLLHEWVGLWFYRRRGWIGGVRRQLGTGSS